MPELSIIIVSYNTRGLLRDCLHSFVPTGDGPSMETFVVDNASADGSAEMVAAEFPSVRLINNANNEGFAAANNIALRQAEGRYVVLLNPDTRVMPGAFTELVRFMDATPAAGYCGPRLLNDDDSHQASARRFPTIFSSVYSMLGFAGRCPRSRHSLNLHLQHGDRSAFQADWLSGACLMARSAVVRDVGCLDDGFFMYFEETDWCRRMAAAGWQGWYVPSAEVVHLGGQSVGGQMAGRPFSGDHPVHWVRSSRRYMQRYHGLLGAWLSEWLQVLLYALIWLRHRWRSSDTSRNKARVAAAALRHIMKNTSGHAESAA